MASEQSDDSNPQIRALRQCTRDLLKAIRTADLPDLTLQLFAEHLIELDIVDYCELQVTTSQKCSKIVSTVIKTVGASPHLFESLVAVLSESGNTALMSVGEELKQTYELFKELLTATFCDSHSFHTHLHHSPITPPQQQSPAIHRYANYLRDVYKRSELSNPACYKWMRSPGKTFKFINLAVISKRETTEKEADKIKKEAVCGNIDVILKKETPIAMGNILQVEQGQSLTCILMVGAPGIGKSMLAWEICQRWGRGELYQEYSIVLLVTLRDERVQRATCVVDLFYHSDKELKETIVKEICNGEGILILLEGLDELPQHLLTSYSVFTDLLSGTIFPKATLLVTSRPHATDMLWQRWWQQISRHIEILGFTEKNINEYSKSVLSNHQLLDFNKYLSIHPHIKSMMYVPLHCVIATAVFLQCQQSNRPPPKTLTGLYTCLTQTILMQYLQDHPDYKEKKCQLTSFSDLPSPVYDHFKSLCSLAFDGVDKQQLIFHSYKLPLSLDTAQPFEHLGFLNAVPELSLLPHQLHQYSYNFLHLSVQEYLAAYHISLMSHQEQEQLLHTIRHHSHCFNMIQFLAGITQLKHLNKELVKEIVGIRYSEKETSMSNYTLEFLYECQDVSILDSKCSYTVNIQRNDSVHHLMALGYCIAKSNSKWHIQFSGRDNSGTEILCHSLMENPHTTYSIETIECSNCASGFTHQVLQNIPKGTLKKISIQHVHYDTQPLPPCLPELIPKMEKLNTLILKNILCSSLAELMPALSRVPTLKYLVIGIWNDMKFLTKDLSAGIFCSTNFRSEFLHQFLLALPQHAIKLSSLEIEYEVEWIQDHYQPIPPCLPELIPRMKKLNTLILKNVLDTSLAELIPALYRVPTLRNLLILTDRNKYEFLADNHIISIGCTPEFLDQLLPALPQQGITSLTIDYRHGCQNFIEDEYHIFQQLPSSLSELIPRMKRLDTLILNNVLDTSLNMLIPALSTLRNLIILDRNFTFRMEFEDIHSRTTIVSINCMPKFLDQLLLALPQQNIASIKSLIIRFESKYESDYHQNKALSTPQCLPELLPRMMALNTLILESVLVFDTSWIKLVPSLSGVHTLRHLQLSDRKNIFEMKSTLDISTAIFLDQILPTPQLKHDTINIKSTAIFLDQILPTTQLKHDTIKSTAIFLDQILPALPWQCLENIKSLTIYYQHSHLLLPRLILMQRLSTLVLVNVNFDTLLTETNLVLALCDVFTLRNLIISDRKSTSLKIKSPAEYLSTDGIIESINCASAFLDQLLPTLSQLSILPVYIIHPTSLIIEYEVEDELNYPQYYHQPQPIPHCLPVFIQRLNTLTLKNVLDTSLTELIPLLSRVPTLRNLTLSDLNSEGIALLCQWLPTCQLETLKLPLLSPDYIKTELISALSRVPTLKKLRLSKLNSKSIALLCQWLAPTCQLEYNYDCDYENEDEYEYDFEDEEDENAEDKDEDEDEEENEDEDEDEEENEDEDEDEDKDKDEDKDEDA